jgi:hypothetical protein
MQRDDTVTWGVVDEAAEADSTDANHGDGFRTLVASLRVRGRLLGGVLGLVGLSALLVGAYTLTDPLLLSLLFLVAPAFVLLAVVGLLRGGDLVDPRV